MENLPLIPKPAIIINVQESIETFLFKITFNIRTTVSKPTECSQNPNYGANTPNK